MKNLKRIYSDPTKLKAVPILQYGYADSKILRRKSQDVKSFKLKNSNDLIHKLKLTAVLSYLIKIENNLHSISACQIKELYNCFCIFKNHENSFFNTRSDRLQIENFDTYINPKVIEVSNETEQNYEFCSSFKILKVKSHRPKSIRIKYFNEQGEQQEKELSGFEARMILHEMDHLLGIPFIDWKVSQGEIEILENYVEKFQSLSAIIEFYRQRIKDFKFYHIKDNTKIKVDYLNDSQIQTSFDKCMLMDIEKNIRKDLKKQI